MSRKAKFLAQNETTIMLAEYKKVTYQEMGFDKFIWRTITDGESVNCINSLTVLYGAMITADY